MHLDLLQNVDNIEHSAEFSNGNCSTIEIRELHGKTLPVYKKC